MKERLKSFLKRRPKLYNFARKGYFAFHSIHYNLAVRLSGIDLEQKRWATRHLRKGNDWGDEEGDWIKGYWDSRNHSHRNFLIERICKFSPSSILEIGCNCGPNLYLLAKKFPDAEITGIDINPLAIQKGNEWFAQEGISNVKLSVGKADNLGGFQDKSFDIVFTDAVLMYIEPDKIEGVIKEMLRIRRKALILLEQYCSNSKSNPHGIYVGHWTRDYVSLLKEFVPEEKIHVTKMPEELWADQNWQRWGGIIEAII